MCRYFLFLLLSVTSLSRGNSDGETDVHFDAWARATAPGATTGAIYGELKNQGTRILSLTGVSFESSGHAMIHRTVERDGMMRMVHADIRLDPGQSVILEPGGLHIMLMGLHSPLKQGCQYSVSLEWSGEPTTTHDFSTGGFAQSAKPEQGQPCL